MTVGLVTVALPAAIAIVMLGLGLSLTAADFHRVLIYPRAVLIALACQLLVLPVICLGLVLAFDLPPALAVGMMLLAASPGGPVANLYSHLFDGDVALNVTLTAINSVISVITLPIVTNLSLHYFFTRQEGIGLQFTKVVQVFAIVLVPVAAGMAIRARWPGLADRAQRPVKIFSVVVLVGIIIVATAQEGRNLLAHLGAIALITLVFSLVNLTVGYWAPRLGGVPRDQAIASCMEIGLHNSTLAATIALSPGILNNAEMALPAGIYGIWVLFTASGFGLLLQRGRTNDPTLPSPGRHPPRPTSGTGPDSPPAQRGRRTGSRGR